MNIDKNLMILNDIKIDSRYFKSKINLVKILDGLKSTDDISIFVDEKILPEINNSDFEYENYLMIIDATILLGAYGKDKKLKNNELKSFVLILLDLFYNNIADSIVSLNKKEINIRNKSIEFLNSLNHLEIDETLKIRLLIEFVLNSHEKEKELIKKSVMLYPDHIDRINDVEGKGFSAKVRYILDSYFIENKINMTEREITNKLDTNLSNIYYKLKDEVLKLDNGIEVKPVNNYIVFSYVYRFLKISFERNKMKLYLYFNENKPFDDYKKITKNLKTKGKRNEFYFTIDNFEDFNYTLFLIKQAYENNNQDIYSFTAFNTSIEKLFNKIDRYEFPFNKSKISKNGLFVLFEKSEKFRNMDRIVYVGSNIKKDRLIKMLNYIFKEGNRENTTLRRNIGTCLLNKGDEKLFKKFGIDYNPKLINMWDMDIKEFNQEYGTDSIENKQMEKVEKIVSNYIQDNFSFSFIEIEDKLKRSYIKSKIISTLSLAEENKPSNQWLGHYSSRKKIQDSGLYLEHHLFNKENLITKEEIGFLEDLANKLEN